MSEVICFYENETSTDWRQLTRASSIETMDLGFVIGLSSLGTGPEALSDSAIFVGSDGKLDDDGMSCGAIFARRDLPMVELLALLNVLDEGNGLSPTK